MPKLRHNLSLSRVIACESVRREQSGLFSFVGYNPFNTIRFQKDSLPPPFAVFAQFDVKTPVTEHPEIAFKIECEHKHKEHVKFDEFRLECIKQNHSNLFLLINFPYFPSGHDGLHMISWSEHGDVFQEMLKVELVEIDI